MLFFRIFKGSLLQKANISEFENKLISWCIGKFDREYSDLVEDSKNKNEIEAIKHIEKVHKKAKERLTQNYDIESMFVF